MPPNGAADDAAADQNEPMANDTRANGERLTMTRTIKTRTSGSKEEKATDSASRLIDARIKELGDWRGEMLARVRTLIKQADPSAVEDWKWRGVPVWYHDGIICTGETYKSVVKLTFARGASIHGVNGLDVHILEAGYESPGRPLALLLHGFPDLAYGWRHLIPILADAGYHVVAPDQRGFGRTTGWVNGYDAQLGPFSLLNMTRDALGLVSALGYRRTAMLVGHDFGSPVAAYCALARPDVFPSVVLMSAPVPRSAGVSVQHCGKRGIVGSTEHWKSKVSGRAGGARSAAKALSTILEHTGGEQ
jgi:hypothetical protein